MTSRPEADPRRPREVTVGGLQAVVGGVVALGGMLNAALTLHSSQMRHTLHDVLTGNRALAGTLSVDAALRIVQYAILAVGAACAVSVVLGVFVLRQHAGARIGLTVLGAVVGLPSLLGGSTGIVVVAYVGLSLWMLWSRPARAWFAASSGPAPGHGSQNSMRPFG